MSQSTIEYLKMAIPLFAVILAFTLNRIFEKSQPKQLRVRFRAESAGGVELEKEIVWQFHVENVGRELCENNLFLVEVKGDCKMDKVRAVKSAPIQIDCSFDRNGESSKSYWLRIGPLYPGDSVQLEVLFRGKDDLWPDLRYRGGSGVVIKYDRGCMEVVGFLFWLSMPFWLRWILGDSLWWLGFMVVWIFALSLFSPGFQRIKKE